MQFRIGGKTCVKYSNFLEFDGWFCWFGPSVFQCFNAARWSSTMPTFGWTSKTQILAPWSLRFKRFERSCVFGWQPRSVLEIGSQQFFLRRCFWFGLLFFLQTEGSNVDRFLSLLMWQKQIGRSKLESFPMKLCWIEHLRNILNGWAAGTTRWFVIPDDGWSPHGWFNMVQFSFGNFLGWWVMELEETKKILVFLRNYPKILWKVRLWREFDSWNTCIWLMWGMQVCMTNLKDLLVQSVDG